MKEIKEKIINELLKKYPDLEISIRGAIEKAFDEGYKLGLDQSETERWKGLAERAQVLSNTYKKQFEEYTKRAKDGFIKLDEEYNKFKGVIK